MALISRDWAGGMPQGGRRIDDANDFLRLEVAEALSSTTAVLPVLIGDVAMPSASELLDGLRRLADLQAVKIDATHREASLRALVSAVQRTLDEVHEARWAPTQADGIELGFSGAFRLDT